MVVEGTFDKYAPKKAYVRTYIIIGFSQNIYDEYDSSIMPSFIPKLIQNNFITVSKVNYILIGNNNDK